MTILPITKCNSPLYWNNCYSWTFDLIAPESFAHPAKMSPALCFHILEHLQELGLLKESDTIFDPMSGTGMTNICAGAKGFKSVSIELESKFVEFQKQNKSYAERKLYHPLDWQIIQGDSRKLSELLTERGLVTVSSPPYGNEAKGLSQEEYDKKQAIVNDERLRRGEIKGGIGRSGALGVSILNPEGYGKTDGQIGALPDRPLKSVMSPPYTNDGEPHRSTPMEEWRGGDKWGGPNSVVRAQGYGSADGQIGSLPDKPLKTVTSPPWETQSGGMKGTGFDNPALLKRHHGGIQKGLGQTAGQIGNEQSETYLSAMKQIYQEIAKVSDVLAIVIKNPTRNGKLRRLDLDTIKILEDTGWKLHCQHRALLFEELEQGDMFTGSQKRVRGRMSFFKRLSWQKGMPVANFEDILICVRKDNQV